jgi:hypothetical protein
MNDLKIYAILTIIVLLAACQSREDDALVVLDEHDRATISSTQSDEQVTFSGSYTVEQASHGHVVEVTAQCGTMRFSYLQSQGVRMMDDEVTNASAYQCGLGTQGSSKIWKLALKPLTGPAMMPPSDWPNKSHMG